MKRDRKYFIIICCLAVLSFFVYAGIYWQLRPTAMDNDIWIFNTPDETANYFFASRYAETSRLSVFEPLNVVSGDLNLVHPRSTTVADNYIAPGSFLGFPLVMGQIGKQVGNNLMVFIVPLTSVLALICFFMLLSEFWGKRTAFWSTILLMIMPAFWYYNSRALFNNVLFVDLLIIGFFFLFVFIDRKRFLSVVVSALIFGLALAIRTADVFWVAIAVIFALSVNFRRIRAYIWLIMPIFVLMPLVPILIQQNVLFGSPITTGYVPEGSTVLFGNNWILGFMRQLIAPFGFNLERIIYNIYYYWANMFWWYFGPAVIGGIAMLVGWRRQSQAKRGYFIFSVVVSLLILLYYGSWFFFNNLIAQPLIGSSQVRYLLPIFILSIPFIVYAVEILVAKMAQALKVAVVFILLAGIFCFSANAVLFDGPESLNSISKTVAGYHQINKQVRSATEEEAVIVTSYNDKVFFPSRKIIFYWQSPEFLSNIKNITEVAPVYLYSVNQDFDLDYIRQNSTLESELILEINETENLYRLN